MLLEVYWRQLTTAGASAGRGYKVCFKIQNITSRETKNMRATVTLSKKFFFRLALAGLLPATASFAVAYASKSTDTNCSLAVARNSSPASSFPSYFFAFTASFRCFDVVPVSYCDSSPKKIASSASLASTSTAKSSATRRISNADGETDYAIANMLKRGLHDKTRSLIGGENKDGLTRYRMHQEYSSDGFTDGGYVKVGTVEIKDTVDNICKLWEDAEHRQEWDKGVCVESRLTEEFGEVYGTVGKVNYIVCKSSIAPWRDFAYQSDKTDAALVGITNFNAVLYVNRDCSDKIRKNWNLIRGSVNSLLLVEPVGFKRCKVSYVVSLNPKGWTWLLPNIVMNSILGDNVLMTLVNMKSYLESQGDLYNDMSLSVEEIARRKLREKMDKERGLDKKNSLLDPVNTYASKEDIEATIKLLNNRLTKLEESEKADKLDLSELKTRVKKDLVKANEQLSRLNSK